MALYIPHSIFIWRGFCMLSRKSLDPATYTRAHKHRNVCVHIKKIWILFLENVCNLFWNQTNPQVYRKTEKKKNLIAVMKYGRNNKIITGKYWIGCSVFTVHYL